MATYKDIELLEKAFDSIEFPVKSTRDMAYLDTVWNAFNKVPTADVVPRSDYEKLLQENAELKRRLGAAIEDIKTAFTVWINPDGSRTYADDICLMCLHNGKCSESQRQRCDTQSVRYFKWRDAQREG